MIAKILRAKVAVEVLLFIGATVGLAFLAQKNFWTPFAAVAVICTLLFALLKIAESSQALRLLHDWETQERELLTTFENCGIKQIFNMQDHRESAERNRVCGDIIDGGSEFSLSGSTGASYVNPAVHRHWDHVRHRLDAGCRFRLLLTNPFCSSKAIRNRLNEISTLIDPKLDLESLSRLRARYPKLEIRFTDEIYCSVFFTERDMMYDPYHLGQVQDRLENRFIAIQFVDVKPPKGTSNFQQLKNHFEFLWDAAVEWDVFMQAHRDKLERYLYRASERSLQSRSIDSSTGSVNDSSVDGSP